MPSRRTPWPAPRLLSNDASSSLSVSVCVLIASPADEMGGRALFRHPNENIVMKSLRRSENARDFQREKDFVLRLSFNRNLIVIQASQWGWPVFEDLTFKQRGYARRPINSV
jgi:hypothetical protein